MPTAFQFRLRVATAVSAAVAIGVAIVLHAEPPEETSPFLAAAGPAAEPASGSAPWDGLQLSAVAHVGEVVDVCLVGPSAAQGRWLRVGIADHGMLALRYDAGREAVLLRAGDREQWMGLRRATVAILPQVKKDDGTIDFAHMALSNREKARKAAVQHWEMLEAARLSRRDDSAGPRPGAATMRMYSAPK